MVSTTVLSSNSLRLSAIKRRGPIESFCHTRPLIKIHLANFLHECADLLGHVGLHLGKLRGDDLVFFFKGRIFDPMIKTAPLERVMNFPRAIGGQKDDRDDVFAATVPISGMVIWKSDSTSSKNASNSISARSISSISSTGGRSRHRFGSLPTTDA